MGCRLLRQSLSPLNGAHVGPCLLLAIQVSLNSFGLMEKCRKATSQDAKLGPGNPSLVDGNAKPEVTWAFAHSGIVAGAGDAFAGLKLRLDYKSGVFSRASAPIFPNHVLA